MSLNESRGLRQFMVPEEDHETKPPRPDPTKGTPIYSGDLSKGLYPEICFGISAGCVCPLRELLQTHLRLSISRFWPPSDSILSCLRQSAAS